MTGDSSQPVDFTGGITATEDLLVYEVRISMEEMDTPPMVEVHEYLHQNGITFDTGITLKQGEPISKSWFLDWSLSGATPRTVVDLLRKHKVPFTLLVDMKEDDA